MTISKKILLLVAIMITVLVGCQPADGTSRATSPSSASSTNTAPEEHGVSSEDLPIHRVVLYQNGVGYFERQGEIESDSITLRIRPDQINDILKSLTVLDLTAGGKAVSISMPVEKTAADQLDDLPTQIQNEGGLLSLLRTFRGASVVLKTKTGDQSGRVVGVESIPTTSDKGQQEPGWRVMLQKDGGTLDVIDVADITGLRIQDRTLELGLEKSLDASLNEGSWKPIELKIRLDSAKKRVVRVSYITEMPVWKPAYRLVVDDSGQGLFQGWSVVDNVSGNDWDGVSMSLIAGNPISFSYDLYKPHFVRRPNLSGRVQYSALTPPKVESVAHNTAANAGYREREQRRGKLAAAAPSPSFGGAAGAGSIAFADKAEDEGESYKVDLDSYASGFGDVAQGKELSSLYEYVVSGKGGPGVKIPDRSSSLVNIAQSKGKAKEIALFQPQPGRNYNAINPFRAVEFHNESGHPLEPGPISLYRSRDDDSTFIGESFLEKTEKGEMAFFTFAMDPLIELSTQELARESVSQITHIKDGLVSSEVKHVNTVTYTLTNKNDEDLETVISRPKRVGWDFTASENTTTTEASQVNYLRVTVPAGGSTTVTLKETRMVPQRMQLNSYNAMNVLEAQLSAEAIDPALASALSDVMTKRAALAILNQDLNNMRARRGELEEIQRLNADLLASIKDIKNAEANKLKRQYSADMNTARTEIVKLRADIALLENKLTLEQRALNALYTQVRFGES